MKLIKKLTILSFSFILILFLFSSCSPKNTDADGQADSAIDSAESKTIKLSPLSTNLPAEPVPYASHLKSETSGLDLILTPYFDSENSLFVGEENREYLQNILLSPVNTNAPLPASDWERIIQILFAFEKRDSLSLNMYVSAFENENMIKRQYAVSGLMKLLSIRYPALTLENNYENVKKSEIIPDLNDISDKHQILIRQAYCLGFTDFTVDSNMLFRPLDNINSGEAISILYRALTNLGLPVLEVADKPIVEVSSATFLASVPKASVISSEVISLEIIQQEYITYLNSLKKLNRTYAKKKIHLLEQAKSIVDIDSEDESIDEPLSISQWRQIFNVFGIESEQIDPYLSYETKGVLTYDVAAISIYKLSEIYGGYETRDASKEELEKAREVIPQFDTARDTSKFAQMFSSGLLDGLYQTPGFTPQRPVNKVEALLIVKRMIEDMSIN